MKKILIALIVMSNVAIASVGRNNTYSFYIENDLSNLYINETSSTAQVKPNNNPDDDKWNSNNSAVIPGQSLQMNIASTDAFSNYNTGYINPIYNDNGLESYNSQATLTITITTPPPDNYWVATCTVPVAFTLKPVGFLRENEMIMNVTTNNKDRVECGDNSTYYVQDDQNGYHSDYLFVHSGWVSN